MHPYNIIGNLDLCKNIRGLAKKHIKEEVEMMEIGMHKYKKYKKQKNYRERYSRKWNNLLERKNYYNSIGPYPYSSKKERQYSTSS